MGLYASSMSIRQIITIVPSSCGNAVVDLLVSLRVTLIRRQNADILCTITVYAAAARAAGIIKQLELMGIGSSYGRIITLPVDYMKPLPIEQASTRITQQKLRFWGTEKNRLQLEALYQQVKNDVHLTFDFLSFVFISSFIGSLSIATDNAIVGVAGMLCSPLMMPILACLLGLGMHDWSLLRQGIRTLLGGVITALLVGLSTGFFLAFLSDETNPWPTKFMLSRGEFVSVPIGVCFAVLCGIALAVSAAGGVNLNNIGVALSASVLPPMVNAGMCFAFPLAGHVLGSKWSITHFHEGGNSTFVREWGWSLSLGSLLLFFANISLIFLSALSILRIKGSWLLKLELSADHRHLPPVAVQHFNENDLFAPPPHVQQSGIHSSHSLQGDRHSQQYYSRNNTSLTFSPHHETVYPPDAPLCLNSPVKEAKDEEEEESSDDRPLNKAYMKINTDIFEANNEMEEYQHAKEENFSKTLKSIATSSVENINAPHVSSPLLLSHLQVTLGDSLSSSKEHPTRDSILSRKFTLATSNANTKALKISNESTLPNISCTMSGFQNPTVKINDNTINTQLQHPTIKPHKTPFLHSTTKLFKSHTSPISPLINLEAGPPRTSSSSHPVAIETPFPSSEGYVIFTEGAVTSPQLTPRQLARVSARAFAGDVSAIGAHDSPHTVSPTIFHRCETNRSFENDSHGCMCHACHKLHCCETHYPSIYRNDNLLLSHNKPSSNTGNPTLKMISPSPESDTSSSQRNVSVIGRHLENVIAPSNNHFKKM